MKKIFALLAFLLFAPYMAFAQDVPLQIDLARDRVDITTGFNGTDVVVFGTLGATEADVILTLKGPEATTFVRRKDRMMGAWLNRDSLEFRRVPSYYDYASTLSDGDMQSLEENLLREGEIGVDYLGFYPEHEGETAELTAQFGDALIRKMQQKGFFPVKSRSVTMVGQRLFKAVFPLPPGVPTGFYTVEALLIERGSITARQSRTLQVGQVGFNARVYLFSENHSFFYGVMAVVLSLFSGWAAFTFLRRD